MMRTLFRYLAGQTGCALAVLALSAAPAAAQVASPFGFFGGRKVYIVDDPASRYGYNLDSPHPGYYGGGDYREWYAFGRGNGIANFPQPVPGPEYYWDWDQPWRRAWTRPPLPTHAEAAPEQPAPEQPAPEQPNPLAVLAVPQGEPIARFTIEVPADAEVFLEGTRTKQTGASRTFVSPPLAAGKQYVYEVRARWTENGQVVEQSRNLIVSAGARLVIRFPQAPNAREQIPAGVPTGLEQ
jgi:uncharacterized protein (TIGR03000 family)